MLKEVKTPNIRTISLFIFKLQRHHYNSTTIKQSHPSGYAASLISSSRGAEKGTGAPCMMTFARTGSRLLGNNVGRRVLSAVPSV